MSVKKDNYKEVQERVNHLSKIIIIPILKGLFPGSEITSLEGLNNSLAHQLDIDCGADIMMKYEGLVYFIASRVSEGFNSRKFTIRYVRDTGTETEYFKRKKAMEKNAVRPKFNIHTYIKGDKITLGLVNSDKLFEFIIEKEKKDELTLTHLGREGELGGASFIEIGWDELNETGIKVIEINTELDKLYEN